MTETQKIIKYCAIAFALLLIVAIIFGIASAVLGILGFFDLFDGALSSDELYEKNIIISDGYSGAIKKLQLEIAATSVEISIGENFSVETNNPKITFKREGDRITVKEKMNFGVSGLNGAVLKISLPEETFLERADLELGAGNVSITDMNIGILELDIGAGNVVIDKLNVTERADIDGGAGEMKLTSATVYRLDFDMGVGSVEISGIFSGDSEIDSGVGELKINFEDGRESYTINIDKGLGNISLDGTNVSSGVYGSGEKRFNISGGIGEITIK